jgi:hypothetical protein
VRGGLDVLGAEVVSTLDAVGLAVTYCVCLGTPIALRLFVWKS